MPEARDLVVQGVGAATGELAGGFFILRVASLVVSAELRRVGSRGVTEGKENILPWAVTQRRRSPLLEWYPRTPLWDITVVLNSGSVDLVTMTICIFLQFFGIGINNAALLSQVQATVQQVQNVIHQFLAVHERLEASLRELSRTGDVQSCKAADGRLKELAKELKPLLGFLQSSSQASQIWPKASKLSSSAVTFNI